MVEPAGYMGIRARPYLNAQDVGTSVEHPEAVVVEAIRMRAEAMTAFDPQDSCQQAFVPPRHSMAAGLPGDSQGTNDPCSSSCRTSAWSHAHPALGSDQATMPSGRSVSTRRRLVDEDGQKVAHRHDADDVVAADDGEVAGPEVEHQTGRGDDGRGRTDGDETGRHDVAGQSASGSPPAASAATTSRSDTMPDPSGWRTIAAPTSQASNTVATARRVISPPTETGSDQSRLRSGSSRESVTTSSSFDDCAYGRVEGPLPVGPRTARLGASRRTQVWPTVRS
jgi:hypothetical protein